MPGTTRRSGVSRWVLAWLYVLMGLPVRILAQCRAQPGGLAWAGGYWHGCTCWCDYLCVHSRNAGHHQAIWGKQVGIGMVVRTDGSLPYQLSVKNLIKKILLVKTFYFHNYSKKNTDSSPVICYQLLSVTITHSVCWWSYLFFYWRRIWNSQCRFYSSALFRPITQT